MAKITVRLKEGRTLNTTSNGAKVKKDSTSEPFEVSSGVYASFRDAFEVVSGDAPKDSPRAQVPGTDDGVDDGRDSTHGEATGTAGGAENQDADLDVVDTEADPLVQELAALGFVIAANDVAAFTDDERDRAVKLVQRKGTNPPKFIKAAAGQPVD